MNINYPITQDELWSALMAKHPPRRVCNNAVLEQVKNDSNNLSRAKRSRLSGNVVLPGKRNRKYSP